MLDLNNRLPLDQLVIGCSCLLERAGTLDEATAFDPDPREGLGYLPSARKVKEYGHRILITLIIPFETTFLTFSPHRVVLRLLCTAPLYERVCLSLCQMVSSSGQGAGPLHLMSPAVPGLSMHESSVGLNAAPPSLLVLWHPSVLRLQHLPMAMADSGAEEGRRS